MWTCESFLQGNVYTRCNCYIVPVTVHCPGNHHVCLYKRHLLKPDMIRINLTHHPRCQTAKVPPTNKLRRPRQRKEPQRKRREGQPTSTMRQDAMSLSTSTNAVFKTQLLQVAAFCHAKGQSHCTATQFTKGQGAEGQQSLKQIQWQDRSDEHNGKAVPSAIAPSMIWKGYFPIRD